MPDESKFTLYIMLCYNTVDSLKSIYEVLTVNLFIVIIDMSINN